MPPEIVALIDKPWLLAILLALGAACGMGVERFVAGQERSKWRAYWQALRKAGIGYHEVIAGHTTPKELRLLVENLVPVAVL